MTHIDTLASKTAHEGHDAVFKTMKRQFPNLRLFKFAVSNLHIDSVNELRRQLEEVCPTLSKHKVIYSIASRKSSLSWRRSSSLFFSI